MTDEDPLAFIGQGPGPARSAVESSEPAAPISESGSEPRQSATERSDVLTRAEVYRGTGRTLGETPRSTSGPASDGVSLDFVNVDVRELVDLVLGEVLGRNYVIDPEIQATVTVRSFDAVSRSDLLPLLEGILATNGIALLADDALIRIVPISRASEATQSAYVVRSGAGRPSGFGAYVIPLRFVSSSFVMEAARSLIGPGRELKALPGRNVILFIGPGSDAQELRELVAAFDVDWMEGKSYALLPVDAAGPAEIASELRVLFSEQAQDSESALVDFVPIERMNAVLVIASNALFVDKARVWVERLDRGFSGPGRRLYVYFVENRRAEDLADALQPLFVQQRQSSAGLATNLDPADSLLASLQLLAEEQRDPAEDAGEGLEPGRVLGDPGSRLPSRAGAPGSAELGTLAVGDNVQIVANQESNALLIAATPQEYRMIEATLKKLDSTPLQVLIEVTIAEVRLEEDLRYGLQWFFRNGDSTITFSSLSSGAVTSAFPGFSYALAMDDFQVVLNALTEITDVRVISSPQLMVLDNQAARLRVGDQVPIATQSAVSVTDPTAPLVNTIQFRDTGVILEVTPRVNSSGLVVVEVVQEVSDVVETTTSDIDSPTIQQRSIESTVAVHSGETVALGGLIRDRNEESSSGVPLLSEIPLLGNLFKTTGDAATRTELLVLITPRVVLDRDDARGVTEELRQRMEGLDATFGRGE